MTAQARISVAISFTIISVIGAGLIYLFWVNQSVAVATGRAALFVGIMACVHVVGYILYVRQDQSNSAAEMAYCTSIRLSPLYSSSIKEALSGNRS